MTTKLNITGMHCRSCKTLIEEVAMDIPGVVACNVDVEACAAEVEHDASFNAADLISEIASLGGYKAEIV